MLRELLLGLLFNVSLEITDSVILIEHLSSKSSAVYLEIKILSAQLDGAAGTKKKVVFKCAHFLDVKGIVEKKLCLKGLNVGICSVSKTDISKPEVYPLFLVGSPEAPETLDIMFELISYFNEQLQYQGLPRRSFTRCCAV